MTPKRSLQSGAKLDVSETQRPRGPQGNVASVLDARMKEFGLSDARDAFISSINVSRVATLVEPQ